MAVGKNIFHSMVEFCGFIYKNTAVKYFINIMDKDFFLEDFTELRAWTIVHFFTMVGNQRPIGLLFNNTCYIA